MSPEPIGVISSIFNLIHYGYRFAEAEAEIKTYHGIVARTSDLLTHVQQVIEAEPNRITEASRRWIFKELQHTKVTLKRAKRAIEDSRQNTTRRPLRIFNWVFKIGSGVQLYSLAVHQCHSTLLAIKNQLVLQDGIRPMGEPPSFANRYPQGMIEGQTRPTSRPSSASPTTRRHLRVGEQEVCLWVLGGSIQDG